MGMGRLLLYFHWFRLMRRAGGRATGEKMETTLTKDRDQDVRGKSWHVHGLFWGSTTQVIHDGTAENPKRNDGCKFTMCWDCWYKSISAQAAEPGERDYSKVP